MACLDSAIRNFDEESRESSDDGSDGDPSYHPSTSRSRQVSSQSTPMDDAPEEGWRTQDYFNNVVEDGINRRKCRAEGCGQTYSSTTVTRPLRIHWEKKHQLKLNTVTNFFFNDDETEDKLVRLLVSQKLPFSLVEAPSFENFCKIMNQRKTIPSRHKVSLVISRTGEKLQHC